jgi:hypothetical protein
MGLKAPEASVGTGLAVGGVAFTVFNMSLPPLTDIRAAEPENGDVFRAERTATWVAAGLVTGVALMTGDATVFIIGGTTVVALAWLYRHANQVHPASGTATGDMDIPGALTSPEPQNDGYLDVGPMVDATYAG